MESGCIKAIGHGSVHKICSGQVVLTLASAVKELVENSLDAGATIIEVKLKEYGGELIEVIDNGKGVKESDFQGITLKHHTSKISDFSDVQFVSTFGFRGEALSSLCALSDVEIVTCHTDSAVGSLLVYDHDGTLVKNSPTHRQVGTTVILKNLFYTYPVRHKEFHRNIRREYTKMIQLLTAYCLISVNQRITCTHITGKGKKSVVLSSNSCNAVKDNIACIFGSKQADDLMEFVQHVPSESDLEEYLLPPSVLKRCGMFRIEGFVSSCSHGDGRSSADRQFFFVNGRPCDLSKVSKLINEVYHSFNKMQYPFVFLNATVQSGSADVNVTPDKRQIFIPDEKLLLCVVKTSLLRMFRPTQMRITSAASFFRGPGEELQHKPSTVPQPEAPKEEKEESRLGSLKRKAEPLISPPAKSSRPREESSEEVPTQNGKDQDTPDSGIVPSRVALTLPYSDDQRKRRSEGSSRPSIKSWAHSPKGVSFAVRHKLVASRVREDSSSPRLSDSSPPSATEVVDEPPPRRRRRPARTVAFSMQEMASGRRSCQTGQIPSVHRRFRCRISPGENKSAEEELAKEIRKEDFSEMLVVGQFNLGFIVCRLRDDLFIVDQHATDEKYHYETLRAREEVRTQALISPQNLDLTAPSECILLDHLPIFERNGFRFEVEEGAPQGKKVRLTSVPVDSHTGEAFGKEDVDEMIFMLTDNPVSVVRPSRVNRMFASRACRKSVMIGTALSHRDMTKLLLHMGEIEQPWNCPHGRPTIRHLFNLNLMKSD